MMQGSLARKLRVLRAERGLTQELAAERIGITSETLSDLERGKRRAYAPTLTKISKGYGVPVEALVEEEPALPLVEGPLRSVRSELVTGPGHDYLALPVETNMRDAEGMSLGELLIRVGYLAAENDYLASLNPRRFADPKAAKAEIKRLRRNFLPTIVELAEIAKRKHDAEVPVERLRAKAS